MFTLPSDSNVRSVGREASIKIPICVKFLRLERNIVVVPPALLQVAPVSVGMSSRDHDGTQALSSDDTRGLAPSGLRHSPLPGGLCAEMSQSVVV